MGFDSLPPQENSRRVPAIEPIVQLPVLQNDRHGGAAETANSFRRYQYCTVAATVHLHSRNFSKEIN